MRSALLGIPIALAAPSARAAFAPPLDRPLTCTITESRDDGHQTRRFMSRRTIVFRRDGVGYLAELVIEPGEAALDGANAMFEAALAALASEPIRFRLTAAGRIVSIDEPDRVWNRLIAAITAMAQGDATRAPLIGAFTRSLAALPPAQRHAMLGSMLDPLLAGDDAERRAGEERAVTIPAGTTGMLIGRETARIVPGGLIEITARAEGTARTGRDTTIAMRLVRVRVLDPTSGLLRHSSEDSITETSVEGVPRRLRTIKTIVIADKVS